MTSVQQQAQDALITSLEKANRLLGKRFPLPQLTFNQRGKIAGSALLQKNLIKLNPILLEENLQAFVDEIIPHELCHLLAYQLYGRVKPHGKEWQSLMQNLFQLVPTTTHQLDVRKVAGRTFTYRCECSSVELSIRRHNRVQRNQQQYQCKTCSAILRYQA